MAVVDFRDFEDAHGFVLHFGGQPNEVDTYTFANALVAFSDAYREINSQVNPNQYIELRLEAVGPGSFRGKIKGIPKQVENTIVFATKHAVLPLLMAFIFNNYLDDDNVQILISEDVVVIEQGDSKLIVPRSSYDAVKELPSPERVHEHVNKAIDAVEDNHSVESIGITVNIDDEKPAVDLPRDTWGRIRLFRKPLEPAETDRKISEEATLSIVKVVFTKAKRKWEFVWRGVKVSAYIDDPVFQVELMEGRYKVGNGDAIRCVLEIDQKWSDENQVWLNTEYTVSKVIEFLPRAQNADIFDR